MNQSSILALVSILLCALTLSSPAWAFGDKKAVDKGATWVSRSDGAISCESGSGRPIEEDARELERAGIRVLDSKKSNDGKMRIQVCGAATGSLNSFLVAPDSIPKAAKLGFSLVQ
jgi:hypothetical protein